MKELERSSEQAWNADISGMGGIGSSAIEAFARTWQDVSMPADGHRHWLVNDYNSLNCTFNFEHHMEERGLPTAAPPDVRSELNRHLGLWRSALPFSEAERALIVEARRAVRPRPLSLPAGPDRKRDLYHAVQRTDVEVVDAGLRRIVKGRDLMRRWWLWRRDMDQYEDQGGLTQAKKSLSDFVGLLIPPENMAAIYYDLQGVERPVPYRRD